MGEVWIKEGKREGKCSLLTRVVIEERVIYMLHNAKWGHYTSIQNIKTKRIFQDINTREIWF